VGYGSFSGSGSIVRSFRAVVFGSEWGRVGSSAIVDDVMAVMLGSSGVSTWVWGMSRPEQGDMGWLPD
jgi:hypothetical protein